ncbi:MAG: glycosyltransferase, partial [Burkholderiaceae bacterium]|nr:glycosyltransferase [Burkholderiaceae bacterium]
MNGVAQRVMAGGAGEGTLTGRWRLIYFSPVPYASYAQRPHFMVRAFADNGYDHVLWIDPYPTRLPTWADFRRLRVRKTQSAFPVDARIQVLRPPALPIEPLPMSGMVNRFVMWRGVCERIMAFANGADYCVLGVGRPTKLAEWALRHVPHGRSFADVLDNFPYFYGGLSRLSMRMRLHALLRMVDDVCCSSTALATEVCRARPDAMIVPNGYSTDGLPNPSEAGQRHCIGYVGTIADWFDWPIVQAMAAALPHVPIRLFGPELIARPGNLPANIELLGEVPQEDVANIVKEFAVGLIPFRIN